MKVTTTGGHGKIVAAPTALLVFNYGHDASHELKHKLKDNPGKPVIFLVDNHGKSHYNTEIFDLAQNHERVYILSYDINSKKVLEKDAQVQYMAPGDRIEGVLDGFTIEATRAPEEGVNFKVTTPEGEVVEG